MKPLPAISLRALEPEDLDLLYRIENDDALWGVGITNVPYSRFLLHEFLSSCTGDIYTDKQVRLVIENEAHQTVGLADLMQIYVVIAVSNDNTLRLFQQMGYQQSARLADWLFDGEHYHDAIVMQHVL